MAGEKLTYWLLFALAIAPTLSIAQEYSEQNRPVEMHLRVVSSLPGVHRSVPAVAWLMPVQGMSVPPFPLQEHYTLIQKNRTFFPHLQVIPVGSAVEFPNADPFYHNVFSLFEGKRFDLGLYEAGSSKSVTFSREGVSYIFCNIHPEMSAVVLALSTPYYAVADSNDSFSLRGLPPGEYKLHLWIEGVPKSFLDGLSRSVHISSRDLDLGTVSAPIARAKEMGHMNKFGNTYDAMPNPPY